MTQYFSKPIEELIKARKSVRTYRDENLEPELKQKLINYMSGVEGINGKPVRLVMIDKETASNGARIGTYGVIKGARHYIAALTSKGDAAALVGLGYKLEKVVLFAASLGLGTVWLGGTFSKGEFAKAAEIKDGEILPIVSPVGYIADKKSVVERIMRNVAGSANRKEWKDLFFDGEPAKPLDEAGAGAYKNALEAVRLAPSASNSQPWRVVRRDGRFSFYEVSKLAQMGFDMHLIDMGIALCHFELAAREAGLEGSWAFEQSSPSAPDKYMFIAEWRIKN
jgi:nitroreductase